MERLQHAIILIIDYSAYHFLDQSVCCLDRLISVKVKNVYQNVLKSQMYTFKLLVLIALTINWFLRFVADKFSVHWSINRFSSDWLTSLLSFSIQSIMSYNGGAVMAMRGKNCVAIAADRRFGIQAQMVTTDFQKIFPMGERLYIGLAGLATDVQTVWVCWTSVSFSISKWQSNSFTTRAAFFEAPWNRFDNFQILCIGTDKH